MVVESLVRQAETLSEGTDQPLEEAFAEVLKTPAGRRLAELADGPHRHERAAQWQAGLMADRDARRPGHLRESGVAGSRYSWLERYTQWAEGKDGGREEYHAYLGEMFASMEG
jgi:hypothetical protein